MLSEEDKKRIAAEEAYRAQLQGGAKPPSQVGIGMKRQAGTILFNVIGLVIVLVVGLAACSMIG